MSAPGTAHARADPAPAADRRSLGRQLHLLAKVVGERLDLELETVGLGRALYLALDQLVGEDRLRQCDLAARLHVESPTLTHHLDHLVERGLVGRTPDGSDRRVVRLEITAAGRAAHAAAARVVGRVDVELQDALAPRELADLRSLLDRVEARARGGGPRPPGRRPHRGAP